MTFIYFYRDVDSFLDRMTLLKYFPKIGKYFIYLFL